MIYDVILVGIFILMIVINAHRGAAKALAGMLCSLVAYLAATALGKIASDWIYETFIRPEIDKAVINAVSSAAANTTEAITTSLPAWLAGLLKINSVDLSTVVGNNISKNAAAITTVVNDTVKPLAVGIVSVLATVLLFFLIYYLLKLLVVRPVLKLFELPGIRGVNRFFGGVIGLIDAFLLVSLLAYLLKLLMPAISSQSGIFNESTIYNSFIFYHFYSGNIFTAITSAIGL